MHKYTVYVENVLENKRAYILRRLKQLFVNLLINYSCIWMTICDELITHPGESYRLWCVVVCDLETS